MNDWGPALLRRLAEKRDVIFFDNVAQVGSSARCPVRASCLPSNYSSSLQLCAQYPVLFTVYSQHQNGGRVLLLMLHKDAPPPTPCSQGLSKEIEPTEGPITPAILEEASTAFQSGAGLSTKFCTEACPAAQGWHCIISQLPPIAASGCVPPD